MPLLYSSRKYPSSNDGRFMRDFKPRSASQQRRQGCLSVAVLLAAISFFGTVVVLLCQMFF